MEILHYLFQEQVHLIFHLSYHGFFYKSFFEKGIFDRQSHLQKHGSCFHADQYNLDLLFGILPIVYALGLQKFLTSKWALSLIAKLDQRWKCSFSLEILQIAALMLLPFH